MSSSLSSSDISWNAKTSLSVNGATTEATQPVRKLSAKHFSKLCKYLKYEEGASQSVLKREKTDVVKSNFTYVEDIQDIQNVQRVDLEYIYAAR